MPLYSQVLDTESIGVSPLRENGQESNSQANDDIYSQNLLYP